MAKQKLIGIYCIINKANQKKYIGQSINIATRIKQHKSDLRANRHSNTHLQSAWNKCGELQFDFLVLEDCLKTDLDEREKFYIEYYDTYFSGYNRDLGGFLNKNISDKTKEKMRYAKPSKPMYQIDFEGNIVNSWYSSAEASKKLFIDNSCIYKCLNGVRKTYKNFIWIYQDEIDNFKFTDYLNGVTQAKSINQYDLDGNLIATFTSAEEVKRKTGISNDCVLRVCHGKRKTSGGFKWSFANQ